jgi:putative PIG3 family NAD(P)H quinone oxidoreductase
MKFIHFDHAGSPEVLYLRETACPEPKSGEVLIKVEAAGVNRPDLLQRKGAYPPPPGASPILGLEVAGTIAAVGPNSGIWKIGDRVCALVAGGGYAEYCTAPAPQCLPIPHGLSMVEAAAIPEAFFTVWANVFMRGQLKPGETLLVHGGSSGIGTTAIQLAHALGSHVFTTAGTDDKCEACLKLGADGAVNYRTHDFVSEIRRLNSDRGIHVILDMVAGDYFRKNLELLASEGRLVQIATQKGEQVTLSIRELMAKGATVTGSTLRPRTVEQKGAIATELREKVWPLLESRKVRVVLDRTYPLAQVADAHRRMESSEHIGKIVLKVV